METCEKCGKYILKQRERDVLKLIIDGFTNKEIGEKLFLSTKTIDKYRQELLIKFDVRNAAGLVREALNKKIFEN